MLKKFAIYWGPVILWAALIFYISSYPTAKTSDAYWEDFTAKKFAHVIFYGIFGILNYRALLSRKEKGLHASRQAAIYAILIATLYGITDEIHQRFAPNRQSAARDIIFDTMGASIGVFIVWKLLQKVPKELKDKALALHLL